MNASAKTLLLVLLLALGGIGVYLALQKPPAPAPTDPAITQPTPTPTTPDDVKDPTVPVEVAPARVETRTERTEVATRPDGRDAPQGFHGRVLAPDRTILAGAPIYLVEGVGTTDLFRMMAMVQSGVIRPPLAVGETAADGTFRLGLSKYTEGAVYEFRVATEQYAELRLPNLRLTKPGEWFPLGDLVVQTGAVATGRVTAQGTGGAPIAGATITFKNATGFPDLSPTPGREGGISTTTDASGFYRATNVPVGMTHIAAVAPNYARAELTNVAIGMEGANDHSFELAKGVSVAGLCMDADGKPVSGAKLTALAISSKTPGTAEARSRADGRFEILGLVDGPYILTYAAEGFVKGEIKPVQAGDQDVQVVLERLGTAKVQVFGKDNRLLTNYELTLKAYHDQGGQVQYGNTEVAPVRARPDKDGITTVAGIAPTDRNSYSFLVQAAGHAMSFTDPFDVKIGVEPPLLIVRMNEGGVLEGVVTDENNKGLAGVTVTTMPNEFDDNPFTKMFLGMMPVKITRTQVVTDDQGRYRIALLNPGDYQLSFTHASYFDVFQKNHRVETGRTTTVPPLQMQPGTVVAGTVTVDGAPTGQIKVTIASAPPAAEMPLPVPGGAPAAAPQGASVFHAEGFTDAQGQFTFPRRVPPGRYVIRAMRQSANTADIFSSMIDSLRTQQNVDVGQGQRELKVVIAINTQDQTPLNQLQQGTGR